jgi:hypothetical protein
VCDKVGGERTSRCRSVVVEGSKDGLLLSREANREKSSVDVASKCRAREPPIEFTKRREIRFRHGKVLLENPVKRKNKKKKNSSE